MNTRNCFSTGMLALCLTLGWSYAAQAAGDHFKALGPNKGQAASDDSLFYPNDFEAAVAARPDPDNLVFFSMCRRAPFNSTSLYMPLSGGNVDAVVGDTAFTLVDGTQCYEPQNEQNIVINPTNSQNVVTSSNDYRYGFQELVYVSMDGGKTFADVLLPGWDAATGGSGAFTHVGAGGDPVLAFGKDGTLYFLALVYDQSFPNRTPSGVAVASSHDGGASWSTPVMVHYESATNFFNDKPWIAAGAGGDVYVTWTHFNQGPHGLGYISSNIVGAVSHDHGQTWSEMIAVSDSAHPFDQGSSPAYGPDGTLYVAYEGNQAGDTTKDQTVVARSTDGGKTFTNAEVGRVYDDVGCYPTNVAQGRARLSFEQFRLSSFPSLAIDPKTGGLAIAWADDQNNSGCASGAASFSGSTNNQVKLVTSADGKTWTAPRQITSGADKAYPAVGANDGRIVVGYYTRDYSPVPTATDHTCQRGFLNDRDTGYPTSPTTPVHYVDNAPVCLDYAFSSSTDNFAAETRVSSQSSNPYLQFSGSFIGDYTGVAVDSAGGVHSVWTDDRGLPNNTTPNQDTIVGNNN
ncbi:MAG: exo-alpha-sialidase [Gammaproteobacteria bacterium]|nr:exo-alpha-sialidase [Gammaproteobacteria bacterium]